MSDTEGIGRRAFIGVAAAAPIAAPVLLNPSGPTPLAQLAETAAPVNGLVGAGMAISDRAKEALGIGPWLKTALGEAEWKAKKRIEREISMQLDQLGYVPDHSVECMKSWSPCFKFTIQRMRREDLAALRQKLNLELYPHNRRDYDYDY